MKIIKCKNYDKLYKNSWEEENTIKICPNCNKHVYINNINPSSGLCSECDKEEDWEVNGLGLNVQKPRRELFDWR